MFTHLIGRIVNSLDSSPWGGATGRGISPAFHQATPRALYTPDERRRRDASPWTIVQGVLAPAQFVVFLVSLVER